MSDSELPCLGPALLGLHEEGSRKCGRDIAGSTFLRTDTAPCGWASRAVENDVDCPTIVASCNLECSYTSVVKKLLLITRAMRDVECWSGLAVA